MFWQALSLTFFYLTLATAQNGCPDRWTTIAGRCYFLGVGRVSQLVAEQRCLERRGRLVYFLDVDQMNAVNAHAVDAGLTTYWIGLKKDAAGTWIWSNNEPANFFNWRPGPPQQPDRCCGGQVNCVLSNYRGTTGQWDDAGCRQAHAGIEGYICIQ